MHPERHNGPRAFTLVEVLVTIGILVVLIALLLPALSIVQRSAKTATCLSNLRQIGAASQLYGQANEDFLPWVIFPGWSPPPGAPQAHWFTLLTPYAGGPELRPPDMTTYPYLIDFPDGRYMASVFRACPEYRQNDVWGSQGSTKPGYGMNAILNLPADGNATGVPAPDGTGAIRINSLRTPSQRIVYGDSVDYHIVLLQQGTSWVFPPNTTPPPNSAYTSGDPLRHGNRACYEFADGHAESLDQGSAINFLSGTSQ